MGKPPVAATDASITPQLAEFLHSGLIMFLATRSADLTPTSVIAAGLRVDAPRRVTVFLTETMAASVLPNLADNGEMAVTMSNVLDHRSIQLKGKLAAVGPASEVDRAFQAQYMERFRPAMTMLGVPRSIAARLAWWPSRAIQMDLREMFVQTPGANAGRPLEVGARSLLGTLP
jgi:Pyridoxamine 5'-phosphate oxidase